MIKNELVMNQLDDQLELVVFFSPQLLCFLPFSKILTSRLEDDGH